MSPETATTRVKDLNVLAICVTDIERSRDFYTRHPGFETAEDVTPRSVLSVSPAESDVYRAAIEYVGWAYRFCEGLAGHRNAKEQLLRASQTIPLKIAEGNGTWTDGDRRRYFETARGSALECGAVQDVLEVCGAMPAAESEKANALLDRIVAMLTKLGQ